MAPQGLEEWLKAAIDRASEDPSLDLDLGHAGGTLELLHRRRTHERDLDPLHLW